MGKAPRLGVFLDIEGRPVLCVGAGRLGERRIQGLLERGAVVTVIAPRAGPRIGELADLGELSWLEREFRAGDVLASGRPWLVHTATGTDTDLAVAAEAEAAGVWCVDAASSKDSPAWVAAAAQGPDGVSVAVSGGGDPTRARALASAVSDALASGSLPVRRRRLGGTGWVALVGAGPGDAGLITVRGRQLLSLADVIVTDRLVPPELVSDVPDDVRVIDVGKQPGRHQVQQEEINEILVENAKAGLAVVRLKGGDPFVLGRGGEEARHCLAHGVAVEWVPGVTSAVAVPAAAGVPVTQRGLSTSFMVASGHEAAREALACGPATTLVLLMGVSRLDATASMLIGAGRDPSTPVVIVERGWTPEQRIVRSDLASAAADARSACIKPPAVIVIGAVAGMPDVLGEVRRVVDT
ncbi:MAG: uroporphyrinogen-III C-methyltransferase [Candidatus Nanopelagicales bacterium]|nr:uroporphyrinogen-III C-methyltransferase [Candidatus Nanopelagicales bacterium]MDZ4249508.1 uroporphyrinogen-III C-methyltransferase [Candidatus Nanopelagicales bacterium]